MRRDDLRDRKYFCDQCPQVARGESLQDRLTVVREALGLVPNRRGQPASDTQSLQGRGPGWAGSRLTAEATVNEDDPFLGGQVVQW